MAIRFDRETKRATNGPLIFFSDPSSEEGLAEEIRGSILSGLSFYCYRAPNSPMVTFGSSEGYEETFGTPGFVIGMFSPELPLITIPYKGTKRSNSFKSFYVYPEKSTSFDEYAAEVDNIIGSLQMKPNSKVVAARVVIRNQQLDLGEKFFELSKKFPEACVFCFSTPATGCWIGASPELLLESNNGYLHTMALAGTRPKGFGGPWDEKNIEEQNIVTKYISDIFKKKDMIPELGKTYTKETGKIEHICTPISANIEDLDLKKLNELIRDLFPTPAVCGYPKDFAFDEINRYEKFDRGCYGGFFGPFHSIKDFSFNVTLRCGSVREDRFCIYAGGGITSKSKVEEEWKETELKVLNTFGK